LLKGIYIISLQSKTVAQSTHTSFPGLELNTTYYSTVTADINSWVSIPSPVAMATTPPPCELVMMVKITNHIG